MIIADDYRGTLFINRLSVRLIGLSSDTARSNRLPAFYTLILSTDRATFLYVYIVQFSAQ